jgi:hypothetical protein
MNALDQTMTSALSCMQAFRLTLKWGRFHPFWRLQGTSCTCGGRPASLDACILGLRAASILKVLTSASEDITLPR